MELSENFLPNIVTVDSSCGCTLTKASFEGLTPARFEALSGKELDLARVIASSAEAKALGVRESGLSTLLKSSIKSVKDKLSTVKFEEQSIILPYIQRRQRRRLNSNYFDIVSSADNAGAGTTLPANTIDITVGLGTSPWKSPLKDIERYFLPGFTIIIMTWDNNTDRNAKVYQYEILSAANANAGGNEQATITVKPLGKTVPTRPTYGIVQIGANNISDWEYHCQNQPVDNNVGLLVNWFQTTRSSRCVSDVYKSTLEKVLAGKLNPWDKDFNYLSLADQNKQAAMRDEEAWMRSVWYNDYLSAAQTPETYASLPTVEDPEQDGCVLEYKANALGIFTQLGENNRVLDLNGAALDLEDLFDTLYSLKKYREADGDRIQVIDCLTDRKTASMVYEVMAKYYKARYGVDTTRFAQIGQKVEFNGIVYFEYDLYDIPDSSVQWGVFREPFFDDQIDAFSATAAGGSAGAADDFKNRARQLWFIDFSDIQIGVGKTNSVTRRSPNPDVQELYKCRMAANIHEYNLRSTQWTTFVDRPYRHLVVQNFSLANPTIGGSIYDVPNPA
jgi:hypothetical protein